VPQEQLKQQLARHLALNRQTLLLQGVAKRIGTGFVNLACLAAFLSRTQQLITVYRVQPGLGILKTMQGVWAVALFVDQENSVPCQA